MAIGYPAAINSTLVFPRSEREQIAYGTIYQEHCHRIYSLAFWITDNELAAEELAGNTFLRAFAGWQSPSADHIDKAFVAEVRELLPLGVLTLQAVEGADVPRVYGNIKRVHLERAVVQLPATEKLVFLFHDVEGYSHECIGRLLGITQDESKCGLHQARLRIRELVSKK